MSNFSFVETVVVLPPSGQIRPVGIFKKLKKAFKRAITLPKKMNSVKDLKKVATLKNIVGIASSFILPGVGSLIVNAAITASDVVKAQEQNKKIKQAAALAAKKDQAAVVQIKESFKTLKAESDKFRAARGLKPLTTTLPDIAKSTPEQIEAAFTTLQKDATAIFEAEERAKTSFAGSSSSTTPGTLSSTNKALIYGGIAVVGLGSLYFLTRKRK